MNEIEAPSKAKLRRTGEAGSALRLEALGDWRIDTVADLGDELTAVGREGPARAVIDLSGIGRLDTSGSWMLYRLAAALAANGAAVSWAGMSVNAERLMEAVAAQAAQATPISPRPPNAGLRLLAWLGQLTIGGGNDFVRWGEILGGVVTGFGRGLVRWRRLRVTSIVHHIDRTGLRAVPINLVIGFLIGVIIAQQAGYQAKYLLVPDLIVVDITAFLLLREIGLLLAAIMLAGRSGSAYTAEIGSMKMREEIDALKVIGLDPNEVLVMPRVLALMVSLPMLTFLLGMAGLIGGAVTCYIYLDMPIEVFFNRLLVTRPENFFAGLIKAVFMAASIGVIAASEGLKVGGSADSLGRHTTTAVVKSILMIIVIDGFFAVFFAVVGF